MNVKDFIAERAKTKKLKSFMKTIGATKNDTQKDINEKIIEYAKTALNPYSIYLTDEQKHDPEFMLSLYRSNLDTTNSHKASEDLEENLDFMLEYFKLYYKYKEENYKKLGFKGTDYLNEVALDHRNLMSNPEFVEMLAEAFPKTNIISLLKEVIRDYSLETSTQSKKKFDAVISQLSEEMLCGQAQKFGSKVINEIPTSHPSHTNMVSAGIECDGFKSLNCIDIKNLLDNKGLILKAFEKDGKESLSTYLKYDISPVRTQNNYCHGEPHEYVYHDKNYEEVQTKLLQDKEIIALLENDNQSSQNTTSTNDNNSGMSL